MEPCVFPFSFLAFSLAITSIVFDMDKVTSGTKFIDNVSNFLYVACDRETFLYLDVSVIGYFIGFSHRIVNDKVYNDDKSLFCPLWRMYARVSTQS